MAPPGYTLPGPNINTPYARTSCNRTPEAAIYDPAPSTRRLLSLPQSCAPPKSYHRPVPLFPTPKRKQSSLCTPKPRTQRFADYTKPRAQPQPSHPPCSPARPSARFPHHMHHQKIYSRPNRVGSSKILEVSIPSGPRAVNLPGCVKVVPGHRPATAAATVYTPTRAPRTAALPNTDARTTTTYPRNAADDGVYKGPQPPATTAPPKCANCHVLCTLWRYGNRKTSQSRLSQSLPLGCSSD